MTCSGLRAQRSYQAQFFTNHLKGKIDYNRLKQIGIQGIVYRVFLDNKEDGGLYFRNTGFRVINPALDLMIKDIEAAGTYTGICAWMIGRKFKWISNKKFLDYQFENGERQQVFKLDIFNPEALKKLINVYRELASHKIDSILIQDDLTLRFNEGFSNWGKAKFTGMTGVPAKENLMMRKNTPYNANWNRVKINQVNKVLKQIIESCKKVNSGIKIGMNIYYETPVYTKRSEAWYAHNLGEIMETGIDNIYLMTYHRQIKSEMKLSENKNRELFQKIVQKAWDVCKEKLVVKVQLRDWDTSERIPADEIKVYLALIPDYIKRICFTPVKPEDYEYLSEILGKTRKWETLNTTSIKTDPLEK